MEHRNGGRISRSRRLQFSTTLKWLEEAGVNEHQMPPMTFPNKGSTFGRMPSSRRNACGVGVRPKGCVQVTDPTSTSHLESCKYKWRLP